MASGAVAQPAAVERAHERLRPEPARWLLAVGALAVTTGLAAANGGYYPSSWGWSALALLWAAIVALLVRERPALRRLEIALAVSVTVLGAWTFLSVIWAASKPQAVLEGQRLLVFVAAVAAVLAVAGRLPVEPLLLGVFAATALIAGYALLTRLLPERIGSYDSLAGYRLNTPIGYWNGLGLFAVMGVLLGLGFAAGSRSSALRVVSACALVVLVPTIYFTFSRGSWLALAAGVAVAFAAGPRRLATSVAIAALTPLPALGAYLASRSPALTHQHSTLSRAVHDGHRLLLWLGLLVLAQAAVAAGYAAAQRRVRVAPPIRQAYAALLVAGLLAALGAFFAHYGSPAHVARHAYHSFTAPPPQGSANLNARLFSFSGNGRWQLWQVAGREVREHPLLGGGAGSFGAYWTQHRPVALEVQDAHNLYLETLAELGPVGLALLGALLAVPVVAGLGARRHRLVPLALGAYAAYLVHAIVDWDWELTGVSLAALLVGTACVLAPRESSSMPQRLADRRFGPAIAAGLAAVSAFALVALLGNAAAGASESSLQAGKWRLAERHARQAIRWLPWSSIGWRELGEARLAGGRPAAARPSLRRALDKDPRNWVLWLDLAASEHGAARRAALLEARRLNPLGDEIRQVAGAP